MTRKKNLAWRDMSPKVREKSETEWLRAENKRLKSENRNLKKQLGRIDKEIQVYENNIDLEEPEVPKMLEEVQSITKCSKCMDTLEFVDLGIRTLILCGTCKTRKSIKK
jgi:predicted  nucleic acid-binding Zn-ribbon protein